MSPGEVLDTKVNHGGLHLNLVTALVTMYMAPLVFLLDST